MKPKIIDCTPTEAERSFPALFNLNPQLQFHKEQNNKVQKKKVLGPEMKQEARMDSRDLNVKSLGCLQIANENAHLAGNKSSDLQRIKHITKTTILT